MCVCVCGVHASPFYAVADERERETWHEAPQDACTIRNEIIQNAKLVCLIAKGEFM